MEGELPSFEYKEKNDSKRKRSIRLIDEQNEEIIDRAFKSRLINKLGFYGLEDDNMSIFGDNFQGTWESDYKPQIESSFTDTTIQKYLQAATESAPSDKLKLLL